MKKLLAALLAMTMVVSLVACGGEDTKKTTEAPKTEAQGDENETAGGDTTGDVTLRMSWWGNQTRTERTEAVLDLYAENHPGVTFDTSALAWADYWTTLAVASSSESLPDLIQQDYAYIAQFAATDDLLDLTPYTESGAVDIADISDAVLKSGMVGDKIVAICNGVNAPAMLYNKTLTDSLGIEVPQNITFEQFAEISKKIYEETGVLTNYGYGKTENLVTYYVRDNGHKSFFQEGGLAYGEAGVLTGWFDFLKKGQDEGWLMPPAMSAENASDSLEQDQLVFFTTPATQSWMTRRFSNQIENYSATAEGIGIEIGITTWPADDPAAANYMKPSQFFSVTTDTIAEETAVDVLNFLINDVDANNILLAERGIPAPSDVAEAIAPNLTPANQKAVEFLNTTVAENSSEIFAPLPDGYNEVVAVIGETIEQFLYGEINSEEAAQKIWDKGNEILGAK